MSATVESMVLRACPEMPPVFCSFCDRQIVEWVPAGYAHPPLSERTWVPVYSETLGGRRQLCYAHTTCSKIVRKGLRALTLNLAFERMADFLDYHHIDDCEGGDNHEPDDPERMED